MRQRTRTSAENNTIRRSIKWFKLVFHLLGQFAYRETRRLTAAQLELSLILPYLGGLPPSANPRRTVKMDELDLRNSKEGALFELELQALKEIEESKAMREEVKPVQLMRMHKRLAGNKERNLI